MPAGGSAGRASGSAAPVVTAVAGSRVRGRPGRAASHPSIAALSAVQEPVIRVNRYLWRSQALKFWPLLERIEALITVAPAAVSVVVSVYWLVAQGPRVVPCSPL
jgi:hypothetical protein